jgi:hypothetical protein
VTSGRDRIKGWDNNDAVCTKNDQRNSGHVIHVPLFRFLFPRVPAFAISPPQETHDTNRQQRDAYIVGRDINNVLAHTYAFIYEFLNTYVYVCIYIYIYTYLFKYT